MALKRTTKTIIISILIIVLILGGTVFIFSMTKNIIKTSEQTKIGDQLIQTATNFEQILNRFESNVLFLANLEELKGFIETKNFLPDIPKDPDSTYEIYKNSLKNEFMNFAENKPSIFQIRYIDETGQEIIRIDRKDVYASVEVVPDNELQNKADRYYFTETMELDKNEVYVSDLDLNIEHGEIEIPFKPTIRYATPVYHTNGERQGIVIIYVLAETILSPLAQTGNYYILVDQDLNYLINTRDQEKEWSKDLKTGYKFDLLGLKENGNLTLLDDNENYFGAAYLIRYNDYDSQKYWTLIRLESYESLFSNLNNLRLNILILNTGIFIIYMIIFTPMICRIGICPEK